MNRYSKKRYIGSKNVSEVLIQNTGEFVSEHEVVLQVLDDDDIPGIEAGLSTIPGKPIPFSITHPDGGFKGKDPESIFSQEIKSVGTMGDAWIDSIGRPKLRAKINITDPEIEDLIKQGKVFISDAYWRDPTTPHISSFDFDHLLIYPRDSNIPQGEQAALIINQDSTETIMSTTEISTTEPTSLEYANALLKTNQDALVEKEKVILTLNQELDNSKKIIAEQQELIVNQTSAIEKLNNQLDEIEKAKKLELNQAIFNSYPEGIRKKFESRFDDLNDPDKSLSLTLEMNQEWGRIPPVVETKVQGSTYVANQEGDPRAEIEAAKTILRGTRVRIDKSGVA